MTIKAVCATVSAIFLAATLTGCGTTQSRVAVWQKGSDRLSIRATADTGNFSTTIVLYVNDQAVATGSTTMVNSVANLSGVYKNIKIDADCKSVAAGSSLHRECTVYANSEKAADLSF